MFIRTIDPTNFDYDISLNVSEEPLHIFYQEVSLNDKGIMMSLIW